MEINRNIKSIVEYNWDDILRKDEVYNTSYSYDTTDNLIYINDSLGNEFRFRYDSLGRKIQLDDPDLGTWYYKYDLIGNLVQQVGGGGNLITGDGSYRKYNELNQLIRVRNGSNSSGNILEEYSYDPYGDRIKIKRYDMANTTVYTPYQDWARIINASGSYDFTYIYDGPTLVARINPDGSKHYFHDDHLGSVSLITNQSGAVIEQTFFEPFGLVEEGGTVEDKLYTGQFSDDLTGQYYYGARYYLPIRGQFGQPDSIIQNVYDPKNLNKYSYVRNNPYKYVDPSGMIVLYIGVGYQIGGGYGSVGATGYALSYSFNDELQIGRYDRIGQGSVSPTASSFGELGISLFQNNLAEFEGETFDFGGDVNIPNPVNPLFTTGGLGMSIPIDPKTGKYLWKKSAIEVTGSVTDVNPPYIRASAYVATSQTKVTYIIGGNTASGQSSNQAGSSGFTNQQQPQPQPNPYRPPHPPRPTPQPSPSPSPQPSPIWNPFKPKPTPPCYCLR